MSNKRGIKISNEEVNVLTALDTDLRFNSQYPTVKIKETVTISMAVPLNVVLAGAVQNRFRASHFHNLGYIPLVTPELVVIENPDAFGGTEFSLNDNIQRLPPGGSYGPPVATDEYATISVSDSEVILSIIQLGDTFFLTDDVTFPAHTVTADVVIYYNRVDETADYT